MPPARTMPITASMDELDRAARATAKIRVRGAVVARGDGYSGSYRNKWLELACHDARVRLTAGVGTPLGTAPVGAVLDVAVTLTGLVDLAQRTYYGRLAQLIAAEIGS